MTEVLKILEERLQAEQSLGQTLTKLLQRCPEGAIHVSTMRGHPHYYRILGDQRAYLGAEDADLVKELAQKDYYASMLKEAVKETNALRLFLKHFDPDAHVRIYENLHEEKRRLVIPLIPTDDQFAEKWLEESRAAAAAVKNTHDKPFEFVTANGENVRSKSEQIIADTLRRFDIFYVYECPLRLSDGIVFPDFKVLNRRTRKTYYLEHFGGMDQPGYANDMVKKLKRYERSGFFPGENLLFTIESSEFPLGTKEIETLIRKYLL